MVLLFAKTRARTAHTPEFENTPVSGVLDGYKMYTAYGRSTGAAP